MSPPVGVAAATAAGGAAQLAPRLIGALLRCLPPGLAWRLGAGIGDLVGRLPLRESRRCREHLAKAYPDRDAAWVARTSRRAFRHMGRTAMWTAATLHWDVARLRRRVVVEGAAHLHELAAASRRGEGTVGFTGHFGNWELLSRLGTVLAPLTVVGRRLRSPLADRLVQGARLASGARLVYQDAPFIDFVRELRAGRMLAVLIDQDISRLAGCFVPWFGHLAYTPSGPAALAQLTRSAVIPIFLYRRADRWVLHAGPRRHFPRTSDKEGDVRAITAWITAYEEALVRRAPEQWVWWHRRWRTRPKAESGSPEVRRSGSPVGDGEGPGSA
jgi:KDO2-lipid IV(A) lauroyltransferase